MIENMDAREVGYNAIARIPEEPFRFDAAARSHVRKFVQLLDSV